MKKTIALLAGIMALVGIYFVTRAILSADYARACFWLILTAGNANSFFRYIDD